MNLTKVFETVFPKANPEYSNIIETVLRKYNIFDYDNTLCFLAQCGHESMRFTKFEENLNYSANALIRVFPKYFNSNNVNLYARKPQKIANRVYANRIGNGNEASGDGWKYHGRGAIQITGKANYQACGEFLGIDLITSPELLLESEKCIESAVWFWKANNLEKYSHNHDIKGLTKRINGGYNGLDDRLMLYNQIRNIL